MPQAGLEGSSTVRQSQQYAALREHLLRQNNSEDALDKFCLPAEEAYLSRGDAKEVEDVLATSWRTIIAIAATTPLEETAQQSIVGFVLNLRSRPDLQKGGQICKVEGMMVWRELPTFGWAMRDAWNCAAGEDSPQSSKDHWINLNAFTAALLASSYRQSRDDLGLSLFCIWTVRMALEQEQTSDVAAAAASAWFVYAGPVIKQLCQQDKTFDGKVAKPGAARADQSWRGFSQDRWQIWAQRLAELQGLVSDDSARQLVEQACEAMAEARGPA